MALANSKITYGLVHQILHWATAVLILFLMALGIYMHDLPITTEPEVAYKVWLYSLHKTVGITLLVVAITRIFWAIIQPHPGPLHGGLEAWAAKTVHWLLYGSIIAMPLLGWVHHAATEGYAPIWWPLSQNLPLVPESAAVAHWFGTAHWVAGIILAGSLFLHISGALKHAVIDKDKTLARMVPGKLSAADAAHLQVQTDGKQRSPLGAAFAVVLIGIGATFALNAGKDNALALNATVEKTATAWVIDKENSALSIEIAQMGAPVKGQFVEWDAAVVFDPENLEGASIEAQVSIASLNLADVSDRAKSDEFLNAATHPFATFVSKNVSKTADGFSAEGVLSLAGQEQPLTLPFTFAENAAKATVTAQFDIARLDFGVGTGYADDSTVGRSVKVLLTIEASRGE